jgi:hypothetical protein
MAPSTALGRRVSLCRLYAAALDLGADDYIVKPFGEPGAGYRLTAE